MIVKGVLCQPNEIGKVIRVSTESGMLKAAINATQYEMTYFKDKTVAFVVDEFAKILGKRFNRAIFKDGSDVPETVLQGDFLIVGVTEDGFRDLSDNEIKRYLDLFELPQKFFVEDGELCVFKFRPNEGKSQNSSLIGDIWDKKYDPQQTGRTDEQQKRNRRMNKNLQELLCVLPEQLHNYFSNFVDSVFDLHEYEKKSAFQSGVDFGREMFNNVTQ